MAKLELISPEGLRLDGRRAGELRRIHCKMGVFTKADGSAFFQQGNTQVVVAIYGPREVEEKSQALHDRAVLRCDYSMAAFSGSKSKQERNTVVGALVRQTFEAVVMCSLFPRSQIDIIIQVLQSDGGAVGCAMNAVTLALIDAGIPLRDFVVSASTAYISSVPLLDPNYLESSGGAPELLVAIEPKTQNVVSMEMESKMPMEAFERVAQLAIDGCNLIYQVITNEVRAYSLHLYQTSCSSRRGT